MIKNETHRNIQSLMWMEKPLIHMAAVMDLPNLGWHILIKFVLIPQYDEDDIVRNVEIQIIMKAIIINQWKYENLPSVQVTRLKKCAYMCTPASRYTPTYSKFIRTSMCCARWYANLLWQSAISYHWNYITAFNHVHYLHAQGLLRTTEEIRQNRNGIKM